MKGKFRGLSLILCLVLLLTTGCGSKSETVEETPFSVGRMEGQTYINEYFDIQYKVDETWTILGEEELVDIYNKGCEGFQDDLYLSAMDDAAVKEVLKKRDMEVPIMVAFGNTGSMMIYAMYEMTDPTDSSFHAAYMNAWMEEIKTGISGPGHENVTVKLTTTTFQGEEIDCINSSYTRNGVTVYQKTVPLYEGTYRISVMALSYISFDDAQRMLDDFGTSTEPAVIVQAEPMPVEAEIFEASFVVGFTEGGIYTNEALGLQCELDDSWEFAPIEMLQTEENFVCDDDSINEAIQQGQNLYVMDAESSEGIVSIKIMKADAVMSSGQPLDGREEVFAQSYEKNVTEQLTAAYEQFEVERCTVDFMGEEPFCGFDIFISHQGANVYQRNLFIMKDKFFGTISISGANEESVQMITDCFSKYEP